jgi:hypothetical protein
MYLYVVLTRWWHYFFVLRIQSAYMSVKLVWSEDNIWTLKCATMWIVHYVDVDIEEYVHRFQCSPCVSMASLLIVKICILQSIPFLTPVVRWWSLSNCSQVKISYMLSLLPEITVRETDEFLNTPYQNLFQWALVTFPDLNFVALQFHNLFTCWKIVST